MSESAPTRGFAIISALWMLMILALITASILATARGDARVSRIRANAAEGIALADAGINATIYRLLSPTLASLLPRDGRPFQIDFEGHALTLRLQDEAGKVDLNRAQAELLKGLLLSVGLDPTAAQKETDQILDWREPGTLKRANGANREDYRLAGYVYGPRRGAFRSIDEMRLVMGITQEIFERLQPAITVVSQLQSIDETVAPLTALLALPGMDPDHAAGIIAARHAPADDASLAAGNASFNLVGRAFTIEATLVNGGRRAFRKASVRLSGNYRSPVWIYAWE